MKIIENFFLQENEVFTVFVVEQRFVVGRGCEYFHSFLNTSSIIASDEQIKKIFSKALKTISKNVAPVEKLIKLFCSGFSSVGIAEAITSLCQLFSVNEHQLAGPHVIDPIILQEGKITKKALSQLISLNKDSILRPTIILLLKDNNFNRAKELLSECPDGIKIKLIWNSGKEESYLNVNCGADNIESFVNSFSKQCYNTCSNTPTNLLLNNEWAENSVVKMYSPILFKFRANLLCDQKSAISKELSDFTNIVSNIKSLYENDNNLLRTFECVSKLFKVFCNDYGGKDILDAERIAKELNNEILLAQVYRYAEFLPNYSTKEKIAMYEKGYEIFKNNSMDDNAIYCKNNMLVEQFYTNIVRPEQFKEMQIEAVNSVPGMVGLSHIFNNVGVAYLYCGQSDIAIEYFCRGLDYARNQDRLVQNLALESNKIIAENYSFVFVEQDRMRFLLRRIFDGMGNTNLSFLAADFVLNIVAVAFKQNVKFGVELLNEFAIIDLLQKAFNTNSINSGERHLQIIYLVTHFGGDFVLSNGFKIPTRLNSTGGKREDFIMKYGLNPFDFEIWL